MGLEWHREENLKVHPLEPSPPPPHSSAARHSLHGLSSLRSAAHHEHIPLKETQFICLLRDFKVVAEEVLGTVTTSENLRQVCRSGASVCMCCYVLDPSMSDLLGRIMETYCIHFTMRFFALGKLSNLIVHL